MVVRSVLVFCVFIPLFMTQEAYYWRFYTGPIPPDALEAGKDDNNETNYVGVAHHSQPGGTLIPGTIYPSRKKISYEYGLIAHNTSENVLILCTKHKEQFRWDKTEKYRKVSEVTKDNELQMIFGGSDRYNRSFYVGRTTVPRNQTVVGKVLVVDDGVFESMWIGDIDTGEGFYVTAYEVLLYDPRSSVEKECVVQDIIINMYY